MPGTQLFAAPAAKGRCGGSGRPFHETTLLTTHNSYAVHTPISGQLDLNVRALEFDVQDNDYRAQGGYPSGTTRRATASPTATATRRAMGCGAGWARSGRGPMRTRITRRS